jgi:hypothetical protein
MHVSGLPQNFWLVVQPTPASELADICFKCDFSGFARQVRGGLHEDDIVGIFADEKEALKLSKSLLRIGEEQTTQAGAASFRPTAGLPTQEKAMLATRIIANLCGQEAPDVVLQLQSCHLAVIAQALGTLGLGNGRRDHLGLASAFASIQRMLDVAAVADEP